MCLKCALLEAKVCEVLLECKTEVRWWCTLSPGDTFFLNLAAFITQIASSTSIKTAKTVMRDMKWSIFKCWSFVFWNIDNFMREWHCSTLFSVHVLCNCNCFNNFELLLSYWLLREKKSFFLFSFLTSNCLNWSLCTASFSQEAVLPLNADYGWKHAGVLLLRSARDYLVEDVGRVLKEDNGQQTIKDQ